MTEGQTNIILSVIVLAFAEEVTIGKCLDSVTRWTARLLTYGC
jgi:hypothetical protein